MDCFLCDGIEIIFRVALTLLTLGKHELLLLDIEGVIKVRFGNVNNCNPKAYTSIVLSKRHAKEI